MCGEMELRGCDKGDRGREEVRWVDRSETGLGWGYGGIGWRSREREMGVFRVIGIIIWG